MLTLDNVSFSIGHKKLVDKVSASFQAGKLNLIVGPNGAGKSTIIKLISGQLRPTSGSINFGLENSSTIPIHQLAKGRAVLSQQIDLAFPLKVWEVVMMGRYPHFVTQPSATDEKACQEAMQFFDVGEMAKRNYLTLSGGEKQRVQFARVLAQIWTSEEGVARYLLLDEPLTFLDIHYQLQFLKKLKTLLMQRNLTVLGVLHDLNLVAKYADHVLMLHGGKLMVQGSPERVFTPENIYSVFQIQARLLEQNQTFHLFFD